MQAGLSIHPYDREQHAGEEPQEVVAEVGGEGETHLERHEHGYETDENPPQVRIPHAPQAGEALASAEAALLDQAEQFRHRSQEAFQPILDQSEQQAAQVEQAARDTADRALGEAGKAARALGLVHQLARGETDELDALKRLAEMASRAETVLAELRERCDAVAPARPVTDESASAVYAPEAWQG